MSVLVMFVFGLLSVAFLGTGLNFLSAGLTGQGASTLPASTSVVLGAALLCVALFGRLAVRTGLGRRTPSGTVAFAALPPGSVHRLAQPDGAVLNVTTYGPDDAPAVVFTHGWELTGAEWFYAHQALAQQYRVVVWDLPGLGHSRGPQDQEYALARQAEYLQAVLDLAGPRPVLLAGHSIGGMVTLTWCAQAAPEQLRRVAGLVLSHTTPTNPLRTTWGAPLLTRLEQVLLRPLCKLTIALSPLVRVLNALCYLNGLAYLCHHLFQFAGKETREQLEFVAWSGLKANPAVSARGMLGMFDYDARAVLPALPMPVLVVAGNVDKVTLPAVSDELLSAVPKATGVRLTPGGHLGLLEQHQAWTQAVAAFAHDCFRQPSMTRSAPAQSSQPPVLNRRAQAR